MQAEPEPVCLLGQRVRLWPMSLADAPALFQIHSDERVSRFSSTRPPHRSVAETEAMIRDMLERPGARLWMIDDRQAGHSIRPGYGWIGLFSARPGVADIAISLRRDAQDLRRAREAMSCVLLHGFQQIGFNRIGADIDVDNLGCIRMVEILGFTFEGRLRHFWKTPLGWRDSAIYSIVACDLDRLTPRWIRYVGA